jgi:hypothetical protein
MPASTVPSVSHFIKVTDQKGWYNKTERFTRIPIYVILLINFEANLGD